MDTPNNDYHISFFKPTTDSARRNRNMVVQLVLIWAVAIFGFQILLRILEKPTPEPALLQFQESWSSVNSSDASAEQYQQVAQSVLSVLGKVAIEPSHREVLDHTLSWITYQLAAPGQDEELRAAVVRFEQAAASATDVTDPEYVAEKNRLMPVLADVLGLETRDIRSKIAPLEVRSSFMQSITPSVRQAVPEVMERYLVHNRSALTDTRFLGFPFHYFYTAVFLLILFVGLCWLYCVRTDMFNRKYGIED